MPKRPAPGDGRPLAGAKRPRIAVDRLSNLSDELLLRILSNLDVYNLTTCQRISQRFHSVAGDLQLWKAAYYDRFILPRVARLRKPKVVPGGTENAPSKLPRWLDEGALVKRGTATNWKRQYKLRHKWSKGDCEVKDIPVAARPPTPPLLARLHAGVVYTVDSTHGIRAWSYKNDQELLSSMSLGRSPHGQSQYPTAFAIDTSALDSDVERLAIGFECGDYRLYHYYRSSKRFELTHTHSSTSGDAVRALALNWPYLLSMTDNRILSLYKIDFSDEHAESSCSSRCLTSLQSNTALEPVSLSLRIRPSGILAAIAYSTLSWNSGWSVGVQEISVTPTGELMDSRLASAHSGGFSTLTTASVEGRVETLRPENRQAESRAEYQKLSRPTSLSYAHPYLLASHCDNTLTLYMVTSTAAQLSVAAPRRLWGHTSSVSGAHVESRGKAVSVSSRGDEVRVWELERSNFPGLGGADDGELSVQVTPEKRPSTPARLNMVNKAIADRGSGLGLALQRSEGADSLDVTRGWVGFDETNVVVLREQAHGMQALAVYDFS